jgi:hypothetical protein
MHNLIKSIGVLDVIEMVGGFVRFEKIMDINDPMDFLHLFNGMDKVRSEDFNWSFLYRFNPNRNVMVFNPKLRKVYINQYEIWEILRREFDLNNHEALDTVNKWLKDEYNIDDVMLIISVNLNNIR